MWVWKKIFDQNKVFLPTFYTSFIRDGRQIVKKNKRQGFKIFKKIGIGPQIVDIDFFPAKKFKFWIFSTQK